MKRTFQPSTLKRAHSRFPCSYGNQKRPQGDQCSPCKGSGSTDALTDQNLQRSEASFSRSVRLLKPAEFKRVFQRSKRTADALFTILYRPNGLEQARLGMAIAKKNLNRAVDRNLIKRTVRESFRLRQSHLAGYDMVVMCKKGIPLLERGGLRGSLDKHWSKISGSET